MAVLLEGVDHEGRARLMAILDDDDMASLDPLQRDLRSALGV